MAAPKKSDGQFYLLRNIPTEVWAAAKVKAEAFNPPVSLRWVIIELLRKWGKQAAPATEREVEPKAPTVRKARAVRAPKIPKADAPTVGADAPDLGSSF